MATSPPHMTQRPSSVVVVPNGSSLGCLRKDVVSDLVFEVWIMVSQGLPHHHPQEGGVGAGGRGQKFFFEKVVILTSGGPHKPPLHS